MGYSEQDEQVIACAYDELMAHCAKICKTDDDVNLIKRAFSLAKDAHEGVRRRSGEPYIMHPIGVAKIVVDEIGLGVKSVAAALLHDVVEDTDYTVENIEHMFGPKIAVMVDGLTKMAGVFQSETSEQAENFRKVLLTLSDDVRVIIVKIADRLHNMRTLGSMPPDKQMKITSETIYLFAPLAHRLGLYAIKSELEDLSLKYRFPDEYDRIKEKIEATEAARSQFIDKFNAQIIEKLNENDIEFEISGRVKSIYSIWSKMQRKQVPFEEIYDIFAIRIVFKPSPLIPEKSQCWHIYSLITDIYKPKPDRLRDWINIPKANGYEALHSTVMGPDGVWAEVQIRSQRMDEIAERGLAAHWKYKDDDNADVVKDDVEFERWMRQVRQALSSPTEDAVEFLDNFKLSLYTSEIVVFTPQGESRTLPQGSTALDFAYDIHSKIGNSAIGAKINHKIEPIFTPIASGDQIEIVTSNNAHPTVEWLSHVSTTRAKQNIKNYLKKDKLNTITIGQEIFENKMKEFGITPSARVFHKLLPAYGSSKKDEFYSKLGAGIIDLNDVGKYLRQNSSKKMLKFWSLQLPNPFKFLSGEDKKKAKNLQIDEDAPQFSIASCCNPIPGDEVVGYKTPHTDVIEVHKRSCQVLIKLASQHGNNLTPVTWASHKAMSYLSVLQLRGIDRKGILMELSQVISGEMNINIREVHILSHDGIFEGQVSLYVKNIDDLKMIMDKVAKVKGVDKVNRMENQIE